MTSARLDQILLRFGFVDGEQIKRALARQNENGGRLGTHLLAMRAITEEQLVMALSEQFGIPSILPDEKSVDHALVRALPRGFVQEHAVLPMRLESSTGVLTVAVADPADTTAIDRAAVALGARAVTAMVAPESVLLKLSARLAPAPRRVVELPELFEASREGSSSAVDEPNDDARLGDVLVVSRSAAIKNFLPAIFAREGWRLHVVTDREEFAVTTRNGSFESVLVAQDMADDFMAWMQEFDGAGLGVDISVFPSVSAALLDNPAPYDRTVRSVQQAVRMLAEERGRSAAYPVPYDRIAADVERLARRCGLRRLATDGLSIAVQLLLPGRPFGDLDASLDAARRLAFPWKVDAAIARCAALFEDGMNEDAASPVGEIELGAQILALCWYRHVELHVVDVDGDAMMAEVRSGLRRVAGRLAGLELVESYLRALQEIGPHVAGDGERQILAVGDSPATTRGLVGRLRRIGYPSILAVDPSDAQTLIARRAPAAILFDHDAFGPEAENFCRIHSLNPESLLYVVTSDKDPVVTLALLDAGADDVFAPPHDLDLSAARIDRAIRARAKTVRTAPPRPGQIAASLEAFSFTELLQSLGHGQKSVRVDLTRGDGETATVHLDRGQLVHATCGELTGEDAVYRVITWQDDGDFVVVPVGEFPAPSIQAPLESVLMEGCRLLDEALA